MTPKQLKESAAILCGYDQFTYQFDKHNKALLVFDHSQNPKPCSIGTYIEGTVLTDDDIVLALRKALCHQEGWIHRCQKLIVDLE